MAFKKKGDVKAPESQSNSVQTEVQSKSAETVSEPIIKTFSVCRQAGGWSVVTITSQGDKILERHYTEACPRDMTSLNFKVAVGRYLGTLE